MAAKLSGGGGGKYVIGTTADMNVTPLVDVMLVLLIIFMISAPLLTAGVPVELPQTDANAVDTDTDPVTLSIDKDGAIYIDKDETSYDALLDRVGAAAGGDDPTSKPVFVRADGRAPYSAVARVMARLSAGGFTKLNLITDPAPDPAG